MRLLRTPKEASQWLGAHVQGALTTNSQKINSGDGFIAWPGAATDGRKFVQAALDAGAKACLVEADGIDIFGFDDERIAAYAGLKAATGYIAADYYQQPSHELDVVAITGTNGKTSIAWWLAQALNTLRYRADVKNYESLPKSKLVAQYSCGLVGTLGIGIPGRMVFNGNSTPDPVLLQKGFAAMRDAGAKACAIEATSIGLAEQRLDGTAVRVAVFTNLTQDHLDYHGNMQAYWQAKLALFDWPKLQAAVVNLDDPRGAELMAYCAARGVQTYSVSLLRTDANLWAKNIQHTDGGMQWTVCEADQQAQLACSTVGDYNVSNLMCVLSVLRSLGVDLEMACKAVSQCTSVPGRMECIVNFNAPLVVVDYAHTPDALEKALGALRPTARARGGKLWCLFGCGGNRDATKRPLMATAAQGGADEVVVTSDNPRSEQPEDIIAQIVTGLTASTHVQIQLNRAQAIDFVVQHAQPQDVIILAGKGAENYQDVCGVRHPFSDVAYAKAALYKRLHGATA